MHARLEQEKLAFCILVAIAVDLDSYTLTPSMRSSDRLRRLFSSSKRGRVASRVARCGENVMVMAGRTGDGGWIGGLVRLPDPPPSGAHPRHHTSHITVGGRTNMSVVIFGESDDKFVAGVNNDMQPRFWRHPV